MTIKINGHEVRVGDVWKDVGGVLAHEIVCFTGHETYPIITQCPDGDLCAFTADGWLYASERSDQDLSRPLPQTVTVKKPRDGYRLVEVLSSTHLSDIDGGNCHEAQIIEDES